MKPGNQPSADESKTPPSDRLKTLESKNDLSQGVRIDFQQCEKFFLYAEMAKVRKQCTESSLGNDQKCKEALDELMDKMKLCESSTYKPRS